MSLNVNYRVYVCLCVCLYVGVCLWVCVRAHDYLRMYVHACEREIKNAILISVIICVYILEQG